MKLLLALITIVFFFSIAPLTVVAGDGIRVFINITPIEFDVAPQIINGRAMVPMRAIFEALDCEVEWNAYTRTVTAVTQDNFTISLTIDSTIITIDGQPHEIDVPPQIIDGRTLVPTRFVAEAMGLSVSWVSERRAVVIITNPREFELEAFRLLNEARAEAELPAMEWNEQLAIAARNILYYGAHDSACSTPQLPSRLAQFGFSHIVASEIGAARFEMPQDFVNDLVASLSRHLQRDSSNAQLIGISFRPFGIPDGSSNTFWSVVSAEIDETAEILEISEWGREVWRLFNEERQTEGLSPLYWDNSLTASAKEHSEDMVRNNFTDNFGFDSSHPFERALRHGWQGSELDQGVLTWDIPITPQELVEIFMSSSSSRSFILDANFTHFGAGFFSNECGSMVGWTIKTGK